MPDSPTDPGLEEICGALGALQGRWRRVLFRDGTCDEQAEVSWMWAARAWEEQVKAMAQLQLAESPDLGEVEEWREVRRQAQQIQQECLEYLARPARLIPTTIETYWRERAETAEAEIECTQRRASMDLEEALRNYELGLERGP